MHLLVTDRLSCPRCGPAFGLILLSRALEDRRVLEGELGCANCRERFLVEGGFVALAPEGDPGRGAPPPAPSPGAATPGSPPGAPPPAPPRGPPSPLPLSPLLPDDPEGALRLAAMLGVTEGPATLLLVGDRARHAERLAAMIEGVEVVALHPDLRSEAEVPGVTRIEAGLPLPFFPSTFRGVAVEAGWTEAALAELRRVTAPGARLVLGLPGPEAGPEARTHALTLASHGAREVLLETDRTLVVVR